MDAAVDAVAQWVRTSWPKRTRRGPFPLPEVTSPPVHAVTMTGWEDGFEPRSSVLAHTTRPG